MDLQGKVVLVTGAANGIGRGTALKFSEKGSRLALADIDAEGLKRVQQEIEESGGEALALRVDVSSEGEVTSMVRRTIEEMGSLDVLVSNAGVSVSGPPELVPIEDWRWIVDINLWAHVYAVRAALPYFKERGSGHFVHVASAAGIFGAPGLSAYSMTKFGVFGLAESLAVSLRGLGIGVSVVCPMFVNTDIVLRGRTTQDPSVEIDPEVLRTFSRELLRSQGIPPEQVGEAIVEAVETGRFLVLPHPEVLRMVQSKWADPDGFIGQASEAAAVRWEERMSAIQKDVNSALFFDPEKEASS